MQEQFFPHRAIIDESFCYIFNSYVVRSKGIKKKASGWMDVVNSSLSKSEKLKNKTVLYEESANIPFAAMWKGHIPAGQVNNVYET